jgi:hypothetical protein
LRGAFGNIDVGLNSIKAASLSIGSVVTSGATIGHKDDLNLITLSSGVVNIDGDVYANQLKLNNLDAREM